MLRKGSQDAGSPGAGRVLLLKAVYPEGRCSAPVGVVPKATGSGRVAEAAAPRCPRPGEVAHGAASGPQTPAGHRGSLRGKVSTLILNRLTVVG